MKWVRKRMCTCVTGVPEPALSEPAQQLIGVRSGGERGHYCTTTPRLNLRWGQLLLAALRNRRAPFAGFSATFCVYFCSFGCRLAIVWPRRRRGSKLTRTRHHGQNFSSVPALLPPHLLVHSLPRSSRQPRRTHF